MIASSEWAEQERAGEAVCQAALAGKVIDGRAMLEKLAHIKRLFAQQFPETEQVVRDSSTSVGMTG